MDKHDVTANVLNLLLSKSARWLWLLSASVFEIIAIQCKPELISLCTTKTGLQIMLALIPLLILSCLYLALMVFRLSRNKSVFDRLVPVKGKGYSIDPKTGEAACPRCTTQGKVVFMKDHGANLYCYVCHLGALK